MTLNFDFFIKLHVNTYGTILQTSNKTSFSPRQMSKTLRLKLYSGQNISFTIFAILLTRFLCDLTSAPSTNQDFSLHTDLVPSPLHLSFLPLSILTVPSVRFLLVVLNRLTYLSSFTTHPYTFIFF